MENKKTTVQVRLRYEWQETNASRLRKPIEDYLITALPGANYVSGAVVQAAGVVGDFEQQAEFNNVADWLNALGEPASAYRLWLTQGPNTLDLNIAADGVDLGIRGEASRAAEFRAHIEQFVIAAGLKAKKQPVPVSTPANASNFSRSGDYRLLEDVTADEWLKTVDLLRTWLGEPQTFNGTIALKTEPGTTQEVHTSKAWSEAVSANWADLAKAGIFAYAPVRSANLRVQFADRTVNLNLTAADSHAVREAFAAFESMLKVAPRVSAGVEAELKGERRRYYTAQPITADWVRDKLLVMLGQMAAKRTGFGGSFRETDQEYTVQDFNAWAKEVELRWGQMQAAGCWLSTADSRQAVDVDFDREQVAVDLRRRTGGTGPAVMTFADYESTLGLIPAPARPYQYYRFARRYQKIGDWDGGSDRALADAIDQAIVAAFGEHSRYVFMGASATEGEAAQMQTPYHDKNELLERLRSGVPYVGARIYLQGRRGCDLGVQLLRSEGKVVVRSSIPDAELFKKVAGPFNKIHDLKEYEAESRNAAGEEEKKPARVGNWITGITGVGGLLISGLALFITTTATTKSSLEILAPRDMTDIPGRSCRVEWAVTRKTFWRGEIPETLRARVLVTKEGDQDYKFDTPDASSGITIPFPSDGVYDLTVSAASVPARNVRVTVKTPAPTP